MDRAGLGFDARARNVSITPHRCGFVKGPLQWADGGHLYKAIKPCQKEIYLFNTNAAFHDMLQLLL